MYVYIYIHAYNHNNTYTHNHYSGVRFDRRFGGAKNRSAVKPVLFAKKEDSRFLRRCSSSYQSHLGARDK